jgi:hypothetical protein
MAIRDYRLRSMLGPQASAPRQFDYSFGQPTPPRRPSFDFDQGPTQLGDLGPEAPQQNNASRFYDEMERIRNMDTPGISAYKGALQEMPTQEQYKPNWLNRIASGLSGFSAGMKDAGRGIETAMSLNRAPYEAAMEQYQSKLGGLKEQALMEEKDRQTRMKSMMDAAQLGIDYEDLQRKQNLDLANIGIGQTRAGAAVTAAEAAQQRAQAASRNQYDYTPVQGGFMVTNKFDPSDSKVIPARTIQDAQLAVSQQNARSAATSAGAAVTNAAANTSRAATYAAHPPNSASQFVAPGAQLSARDLALEQMADDPAFAKFFAKGWFGKQSDITSFSKEDQQDYLDELADRIAEIESRKRPIR